MNNRGQHTILLTGVNGQVGFELERSLQGLGRVVAFDRGSLDLADLDQVRQVVRDVRPALIVNPAAHTAVDRAESEPDAAMQLNAYAPEVLANEAKRLGALLVHYSTDYVFDGTKDGAYVEDDPVNPQNAYGRSELAGEQAIVASGCAHLIFRTSWVYGARGKNFLQTMLRLGAERDELSIVSDQIGAPTWSNTISALTSNVLSEVLAGDMDWWGQDSGIYHLTASGSTSWYGFAEAIFERSTLRRKPKLKPTTTESYPTPAARPANSRLSNQKLFKTFGVRAPNWDEALDLCMESRIYRREVHPVT